MPSYKTTLAALALAGLSASAQATIVQFQTVMGDFEVNLYDETTPKAVENFLAYVQAGAYTDSFIHRSMPDFIVQGGGYVFDYEEDVSDPIERLDPVANEPQWANVRGTIAMAKVSGDPDSATSQWFFNLADNTENLDNQNGGFTVFGEVMDDGMDVVDAIAEVERFNAGNGFSSLPLRDFEIPEEGETPTINEDHLVMVNNVVVLDAATDTAADLQPTPTTRDEDAGDDGDGDGYSDGGGGGGSLGLTGLLLLLAGAAVRRLRA